MRNVFVIVGPAKDPAHIRGMKDAAAALRSIAQTQAAFVTRGDKSGTHMKELEVWKKAGVEQQGPWYGVFEQGSKGNAPTLASTSERQAYTITDRATYITMKPKISLQVFVERDDVLLNCMTLIPVNPAKFPQVRRAETMEFVEWLQGREAQAIIRDFGKDKYGNRCSSQTRRKERSSSIPFYRRRIPYETYRRRTGSRSYPDHHLIGPGRAAHPLCVDHKHPKLGTL